MNIRYDTEKIKGIITDLSVLTGISIDIINTNHKIIASCKNQNNFCSALQSRKDYGNECYHSDSELLKRCKESRQLETHICHAGLCDFAMPLIKCDVIVGYVVMGQIRSPLSPDSLQNYSPLNGLYKDIPFFTNQKIESLKNLLPQIFFENAITIEFDSLISQVCEFIETNIYKELTITFLCSELHISKNILYNSFQSYFGVTVNQYITNLRIKKAQMLLKETNEQIYRIAEKVGIHNYTYFFKLFKRKTGMTPTEYRTKKGAVSPRK